ncbi:hypothetical protein PIB30_079441 [Stylosanthes scabra]|uniref:F-box domain-containing protein n=1 Tax=Stylosanthes scabra TaxID=79078 RepID=A0ABU6WQY0_9FABA|nr:hypothetical protein [Stylosanthes scabra]
MSDIPPSRFSVPELPYELMIKILLLCDAKTLLRVQATSHLWMETLSSYHFVHDIESIWRRKGCSLFAHFGYADTSRRSSDWVIKLSSDSGHKFPSVLLFAISNRGWFDVVGVDKGVFCFRLSRTGGVKTVKYAIVAIFLECGKQTRCVFTMYGNTSRVWNARSPCPSFVRKLDPACVTLGGITYWVTWSHDQNQQTPPYIVAFSSLTNTFKKISFPSEALTICHTLLVRDGHLCVAANNHNAEGYTTMIWQVYKAGDDYVWSKLFDISGNAHSFIPGAIVDGDVIQVLERHVQVEELEGMEYTTVHIRKFYEATRRRRSLLWKNYEDDVKLRSLHTYYEGFYPV